MSDVGPQGALVPAERALGQAESPRLGAPPGAGHGRPWAALHHWCTRPAVLGWVPCALALVLYLATRLWALDRFPISFLTDEAANPLRAADLLAHGLRDEQGHWLPLYFEVAPQRWGPLLSVYIHVPAVILFGKSVVATRAVTGVVSLLAPLSATLILRYAFKARAWWSGALLLAATPAWFLHSRTGFETVMAASFYGCFLLCYLLYRTRSPAFLFAALAFGAAAFYTYSNAQLIVVTLGLFLLLSDLPYHLRQWRTTLPAYFLLLILATPLLRFSAEQPGSLIQHLRVIDSYWFRDWPLSAKVGQFFTTYLYGLSPAYWFFPNDHDLVRHRMLGYGNIVLPVLPLFLIGAALCVRWARSPAHRAVAVAALATPAGGALVDIAMTRVIAFVVPAAILAGLGLDWCLDRLGRCLRYPVLALATFAGLAGAGTFMAFDALAHGPLWYRDYGLYGMQYGSRQLFGELVPEYLARDPQVQIMLSSTWANGSDLFVPFFLSPAEQRRVEMLNVDHFLDQKAGLGPDVLLVMTPEEYERAIASPKFASVAVERIVPWPDGRPGFYFARLAYTDNIDAIFAAEREERGRPALGTIDVAGQELTVSYSQIEAGQLADLFDGDPFTLVRGRDANPFVVDLTFPQPRGVRALLATFGSMDFAFSAQLYPAGGGAAVTYAETYRGLPPDPTVRLDFSQGPESVERLRLDIRQLNAGDSAKIHIREIALQ